MKKYFKPSLIWFIAIVNFLVACFFIALNARLASANAELQTQIFTIEEATACYYEGYSQAYKRARVSDPYFFIEQDKITADSLMFIRKLIR